MSLLKYACVAVAALVIGFSAGFISRPVSSTFNDGFKDGVRYGAIAQIDNPAETDLTVITEKAKQWRDLVAKYGSPSPAPRSANR